MTGTAAEVANIMGDYDVANLDPKFSTAYFVVMGIIIILSIAGMWKTFEKANVAGWKSLIPFYNLYLMYEIAGRNGRQFLLLLVPVVNLIAIFSVNISIAKRFGKGTGFGAGLTLFPMIFFLILGYDDSVHTPKQKEEVIGA